MIQDDQQGSLFADFPPISTPEWEQAIHHDLKGADYAKKLIWKSPDGIEIKPYYRAEDLQKLEPTPFNPLSFDFVKQNGEKANTWRIRQDIEVSDLAQAGEKALWMIGRGAESIGFSTDMDFSFDEMTGFLKALPLENVEFSFAGFDPGTLLEALGQLADEGVIDPQKVNGCCEFDPLGGFTLYGSFEFDAEEEFANLADWMEESERFPGLKILGVHGNLFHRAGATLAQELGFSLAAANDYMDGLTEFLVPADLAASKISFHLSAGSDYFMTLAGFRAARMLWDRLLEGYEIEASDRPKLYIQAETSRWNQTVYDAHVNLLRSTTEAMSAALAGVDSITVVPFDDPYEVPTEFAERLARNQQILLKEEAGFDRVADPAAGSYYIETLTSAIAEAAWKVFQWVEEAGGYTEAFYDGLIQDAIVGSAIEHDKNLANRREILLGTNQYPNSNEEMLLKADSSRVTSRFMDSSLAETQPLNLYRASEAFESIRFETERADRKPVVFLLTTGNLAMRKARAAFSANFFGCAGYQVIDNAGFDTVEAGVSAAREAAADMVVLCSSDEEYAALAESFGNLVKPFAIPVIAGYPKEILDQLKSAGMEHFIHVRSNVLETLKTFNALILKNN